MLLDTTPHPVSVAAATVLVVTSFIYLVYSKWTLYRSRQLFKAKHNCQPAHGVYPIKEPIVGFDFAISIMRAAKKRQMMQWFDDNYKKYGRTYIVDTLRGMFIHTSEAENIKSAFAVRFEDWSAGPARAAFKHLLGDATFMIDGPEWAHSRGILRPSFAKDNVAELGLFERHFEELLKQLPQDGSTIDLGNFFSRFSFDVATEFLFGESIGSLEDPQAQLAQDMELSILDCVDRVRFHVLYPLFKRKGAADAGKRVHQSADRYVQAALARANLEEKSNSTASGEKTRYSFLDEIARQTRDPQRMRCEAVSLLFAGRDTTAGLLGNLWFLLARHPRVWEKLQADIDELQGEQPTYEWIRDARYLKYCEHEAMRLLPVTPLLPPRTANKDTVLPLGGGPDGKSPLFVPKGAKLGPSIYSSNRHEEIWGKDAQEFNPDRWEGRRPGWDYTPFSGGPRICIGQQFALTEVYYVTVRLMQCFRRIEPRGPMAFTEKVAVTLTSENGCLVGLSSQ